MLRTLLDPEPISPVVTPPQMAGRILSQSECISLVNRISQFARGGGETKVNIWDAARGNIAWARNQIQTSGNIRFSQITIQRSIRGALGNVISNQLDDAELERSVRRAERLLVQAHEFSDIVPAPFDGTYPSPAIWFDRTDQLDAASRASAVRALVKPAEDAGMLSAGYLEVVSQGAASVFSSGKLIYYPYTTAQYSVTVRDPKGRGSGWAGVDWNDWGRVDAEKLAAVALQKCLDSRNPVAIEPGRYTTILEPQAVCDFISPIFDPRLLIMDRATAEVQQPKRAFSGASEGETLIGKRIFDARITISADPTDPDCAFLPLANDDIYRPVKWFENGVLKELAYSRWAYGIIQMGLNTGLLNRGAFRMSGGPTSIAEMIDTTKRGVLVTRLWDVQVVNEASIMLTGYTRDGVWLIENGKISKPVKNFRFTESPLFALNNLVQLGPPQRVFHPDAPVVVPPLKVNEFSFTSLSDAV